MKPKEIVTDDISQFGYREIKMVIELLEKYIDTPSILGNGVKPMFNKESGYVFLTDENLETAMINYDKPNKPLELWYVCPICSVEGFKEEYGFSESTYKCRTCRTEI